MADVSVKMGVSGISQFKQGMNEAQTSVKTLDAALKANEKAFSRTGDAEAHFAAQTTLLNQKLNQQKQIIANAEKALKQMEDNGVRQSSTAFQNMQRKLIEATSAMMDTEDQLKSLGTEASEAGKKADTLGTTLSGLDKKAGLSQVSSSLETITGALSSAGSKAATLATNLWDIFTSTAESADDLSTAATKAGMSVEDYQRVVKVAAQNGETSVTDLIKAWKKVKMNLTSDSADVADAFSKLGVKTWDWVEDTGFTKKKDYMDAYWEIGEKLLKMSEDQTKAAEVERLAQTLLGRSWEESLPMFQMGREEYEKALEKQNVATEGAIDKWSAFNDSLTKLTGDWETLKTEMLSGIAPALEAATSSLDSLLGKVLEYLESEEGQKALEDLGTAVEGLFSDLGKIDPEDVVSGFQKAFGTIVESVQWLNDHWKDVKIAIEAIGAAFVALEVGQGVTSIITLINGLQSLSTSGAAASAATAGATAGTAWGTAFASAVIKAIPWIAGLVTLVTPGETNAETVYNEETGTLTEAGLAAVKSDTETLESTLKLLGQLFEDTSGMTDSDAAMNAIGGYMLLFKDLNTMVDELEALGYKRKDSVLNNREAQKNPNEQEARTPWADTLETFNENDVGKALKKGAKQELPWDVTMGSIFGSLIKKTLTEAGESSETNLETLAAPFRDLMTKILSGEGEEIPEVKVEPVAEDGSAEKLAEEVGTVEVPVTFKVAGVIGGMMGDIWGDIFEKAEGHANGLPWVPFDGYPAILHRGERVLTAGQNKSYTYNSNNYFGNVNLNNGMQIEALCDSIERHNRQLQEGYGA